MSPNWHSPRHRPSWWPKNEPWPPAHRMRHYPFFRRMGCLFLLVNLFVLAMLAGMITLVARWLGWINFSHDPGQWIIPVEVGLVLVLVLVVSLAGAGVRRVFIPLDDLLKASERVGEGDYSTRVQEKGPRQVRSLARAFNKMAARLHKLDQQRRDLLADLTHELRNPLTVMQGNLEGMLDGVYPANEANLRLLLDETNLMARLVEDLRTLALAESGALQLKKEPTDLALLVRETAATFQAQMDTAGITLTVETPPDLPWLELDPGRIRQVLTNLLANSLRYTPLGGTINIRYRQVEGNAELEVEDSGPGIPADELPHVFERFYKSVDSGGMGLGLAIAKHLVEAHGGTIRAESTTGLGTTMQIVLPMWK